MSSPCHIELILSEKDSTVPAEVGMPLPAYFQLCAVCAPLQCTAPLTHVFAYTALWLDPLNSHAAVEMDALCCLVHYMCSSLPAVSGRHRILNAVLGRHADQQPPGFLQKEATKGTKLTRQQRAKQLRSGVKAITS